MNPYPIRLLVTDDLRRSRLTVFFRLLLAIPHVIWWYLWGIVAGLVLIASWFATLFTGRTPDGIHSFLASFVRYSTHLRAYMFLAADPFPGFGGADPYPLDLEIDGPAPQGRLGVFFRIILLIPVAILLYVLVIVAEVIAVFGWFVALVIARMPQGMEDMLVFCLGYEARALGYMYLLTDRFPPISSPATLPPPPAAM